MKKFPILLAVAMLISSLPCDTSLYGWRNPFSKENKEESGETQEEASGTNPLDEIITICQNLTAKLDATSKVAVTAESTLDKLSTSLDEKVDHEIMQLMESEYHQIGRRYGKTSAATKDILNGTKASIQFSKLKKEPTNFDLKKKTTGINTMKIGLQKLKSMEAKLYKNRAILCILLQCIISKVKQNSAQTSEEGQITTEIRSNILTSTLRNLITAMGDEVKGTFRKKSVDGIEKQLTSLVEKLNTIINDGAIDEEVLPLITDFLNYIKFFVIMHAENLECFSGIMHFLDNNSVKQMEEILEKITALLAYEQPQQSTSTRNEGQDDD